jgi:hypothetical protein
MLNELAIKYGIHLESTRPVSKPKLTKNERKFINGLKRKYRADIRNASDMRVDIMNMTMGLSRSKIISILSEQKENAALLAMLFNNEQLALLFALKDELTTRETENV